MHRIALHLLRVNRACRGWLEAFFMRLDPCRRVADRRLEFVRRDVRDIRAVRVLPIQRSGLFD